MDDTEVFVNSNCSENEKETFMEDQRNTSLWYLAFRSHPAWFCVAKHSSLSAAAIKEWMNYHRLSVALSKETIVQIIENVTQVIPNSKLAKYGDYSYDIDYEDMCCMPEDVNINSHILKAYKHLYAKRYDFWESATESDIFDQGNSNMYSACNRSNLLDRNCSVSSLSEWLEMLHLILIKVKHIANEAKLFDSWTETLLKYCLRFVNISRNDQHFVKVLNQKIPFIIDYEELRKIPITKIELKSIPQPEGKEDLFLDNKSVETLWLKLSSPQIQNIWKKIYLNINSENRNSKHLVPLTQLNFLRSCQTKKTEFPTQAISIPKNMESELLGSLLNVINEDSLQSDKTLTKLDDAHLNYFPEAHGEWTNQLFPHPCNPIFEKDSIIRKPSLETKSSSILQVSDLAVKVEKSSVENATMPIQFYKSIPPPTLAARIRPPCVQYQPRNKLIFVPPNNLISSPSNLQVQYKFPTPVFNALSPTYVAQASPICNIPQRQPALIYANIAQKYHTTNFLQTPYQYNKLYNLRDLQESPSKTAENAFSENTLTENETKDLSEEKQMPTNTPKSTTAPLVQLNHGYNIPFRIEKNLGNITGNTSTISKSAISNSQLKGFEQRIPPKINYPIMSHRLRTPLIKNTLSKNHYVFPQFTFKPRFLGPISINNIKRLQERLFLQRHQYDYINTPPLQDVQKTSIENLQHKDIGYENKVEKWLASINKYVISGSFINLEDLAELEISELSDCNIKSDDGDETNCVKLEKFRNENIFKVLHEESPCNETKSSLNSPNKVNEQIFENKMKIQRRKKLKAKKVFFEHLQLFKNMANDLKKCKNLRRKIKVAKKYFSDINLASTGRFYFGILKMKYGFGFIKKIKKRNKTEFSESKQKHSFGTKFSYPFSTENNFNMKQSSMLINDCSKCKIFSRENQEFNSFPSKRKKLNNLEPSFFKPETLIRDQQDQWISSLYYFDVTIDKLLFSLDAIEGIHDGMQSAMENAEVNGWTHFKIAIKTIMENAISSLNVQISQNL